MRKSLIRSLFRFRLRTLLMLVTVFVVWLGFQVHRTRQQADAVSAIQSLGGRITYGYQHEAQGVGAEAESYVPQWLWPIFGRGNVECVVFTKVPVGDSDLRELPQHLEQLPHFRLLTLAHTKIGDETVRRISHLRNFEWLNLDGTRITDVALDQMPNIKGVSLVHADITDAGLERLKELSNLRYASLGQNKYITQAAFDDLHNTLEKRRAR